MAAVVVRRIEYGYRDRWRAYRILIDGRKVGKLKRGQSARFELPAGLHTIQAAVDWMHSAKFHISGDVPEIYRLRCGPSGSPLTAWRDIHKRGDETWLFLEPDDE
jgi:hypothetical protein